MGPRNVKLTLEYDGTAYAGWQRQTNAPTIQQTIEEALERMLHAFTCLRGAGRTDAGVHARGQVANFHTTAAIPLLGLQRGLNSLLPRDIAVVAAEEVSPDFDARRSARGKHYRYQIWNREARAPLRDRFAWNVHRRLDRDAMRAAAAALIGEHDFSAFRAVDCDRKNPVRLMRRIEVSEPQPDLVVIDLEATAFLKHMVRIIVGTLTEVGLGYRRPGEVATILAGRDRTAAGRTAPAKGLILERVFY